MVRAKCHAIVAFRAEADQHVNFADSQPLSEIARREQSKAKYRWYDPIWPRGPLEH
jgi:hypothetical protein